MTTHRIVPHTEWLEARKALLAEEKAFSRARDRLTALRQALPWERVDKSYSFEGPKGRVGFEGLFDGRSQLIAYHFMFGPDWEQGCKSCSFLAEAFDGMLTHLHARDVSLVAVSRAPLAKLEAFKKRLGWRFPWYSSLGSAFNFDYGVSFTPEALAKGEATYNYVTAKVTIAEHPGASVFYKDESGAVFHTYSTYARGLEPLIAAYSYLDLVPKGRDEAGLSFPMAWVRIHDQYERKEPA
jgi:predicted dithiol-disulfide oxidoreductase (DUF899 family)